MEAKMDPRIYFLLCMHTKTSPQFCIVPPFKLSMFLEAAAFNFCEREIKITSKNISLPMLFYWYQSDFLHAVESHLNAFEPPSDLLSPRLSSRYHVSGGECGYPFVRWLTEQQRKKIAMIDENFTISYKFDWSLSQTTCEQNFGIS
eukprot:TRINITY_DN4077_c0_g3_i17.p1 TRINITY_DN4077_c0_g3~~TRINITY_DN4077_c0_g3_i17.p1  ORF type:complete len:146 (-),score=32.15 TRINITY_DN4077_c0_g3_i17:101-538(-)